MKKLAIAVLYLGCAATLQAAPFAVQPQPGLWQIRSQTFAEGKDIGPQLQFIKQQAAAFLKPNQLDKLKQYDPSLFTTCLSNKEAQVLADPQKSLDMVSKALGQCQLQIDQQTANGIGFSGYCNASKHGIEGQVKGQLDYQSSTQASGYVEGTGTLPPPVQLLLIGRTQSQIHVRNNFTANWQLARCSGQ